MIRYYKDTNHFRSHKVYNGIGSFKIIDNEAVESFSRCLRVYKLVGLDIDQRYYPHRVCKQFVILKTFQQILYRLKTVKIIGLTTLH